MMKRKTLTVTMRGSWRNLWRRRKVRLQCQYILNQDGEIHSAEFVAIENHKEKN